MFLSQTTVVSRWLVTPTAAMSAGGGPGFFQRPFDDVLGALPNFHGVVLDPAGLGIDLFVFHLMSADRFAGSD